MPDSRYFDSFDGFPGHGGKVAFSQSTDDELMRFYHSDCPTPSRQRRLLCIVKNCADDITCAITTKDVSLHANRRNQKDTVFCTDMSIYLQADIGFTQQSKSIQVKV